MPKRDPEPDIETALCWWSELPDKWTPVGWKDHLFRFNVLFNGTIFAQPCLNQRTKAYEGQGVQLSFPSLAKQHDDGSVLQGWNECPAPVLWTEWSRDGCLIRKEIFAWIPGAEDTKRGDEPLYAWIRLYVHDILEALPLDDHIEVPIALNAPHIAVNMHRRNNMRYDLDRSRYPRTLAPDRDSQTLDKPWRLMEEGDRVRLAIAPSAGCGVRFEPGKPTERDCAITLSLPTKKGYGVDILLPMLPTRRQDLDIVLEHGREKALSEANRYWSSRPPTAARFECPEDYINRAIRHNLRMAEIIAERNPQTGICSILSGSWAYARLWATPSSMALIMLLDAMGYHSTVEKYLAVFKREQGTVIPPGSAFRELAGASSGSPEESDHKTHPGYLSTPRSLTSINWLTDHGALLWAISKHALLSGNTHFIDEWVPVVLKACEFIHDARAIRGHKGVEGLMPPAVASDLQTEIQAVWTDGWNYLGLETAVRLLRRIGHPRAEEFEKEAADYRNVFRKAIYARAASMPQWTDEQGRQHPFAPIAMFGEQKMELRHAFYLDAGPLFLVFSGLLDARDALMKSTLKWFREGPQTRWYRFDSDCWQVPCLVHEISSCEPCYSWNIFHSHKLGDRQHFLEGIYSLFAGAYSRQTFTVCETRGGITGTCHWLPSVWLARLAIIDDQLVHDELHLLRLIPLAWVREDRDAKFENLPTEFGPVSLGIRLGDEGRRLEISYSPRFRIRPGRTLLHIPPVRGLKTIFVNDRPLDWDGRSRTLDISG